MRFRHLEASIKAAVAEAMPRLMSAEDAHAASQRATEEAKVRAALTAVLKEDESVPMPVRKTVGYGRNDFITIKKGDKTQTLKFKKAEPLIADGWTIVANTL